MQKFFFSSFWLTVVVSRRQSSSKCDNDDIARLGGGGAGVVSSLSSCIPEVVSEMNFEQIEACVEMSFIPEFLSRDCNRCSVEYLHDNELELKSCLMKCSGIARGTHKCQKCTEGIAKTWDEACLPRSQSEESFLSRSTNVLRSPVRLTYIVIPIIFVVLF